MFSISKFIYNLTANMPCRLIARVPGEPYLERYFVGEFFGATIYLHRFVQFDVDKELHDHPWSWNASFILCGEYREELVKWLNPECGIQVRVKLRRWFNFFTAGTFHRIATAKPETWTLFVHGPRVKRWGFLSAEFDDIDGDWSVLYAGYPPSAPRWFEHAPDGYEAGRAPYMIGVKT